jgi:hypothetical protein
MGNAPRKTPKMAAILHVRANLATSKRRSPIVPGKARRPYGANKAV